MSDMFAEFFDTPDIKPALNKIKKIPFAGYTGNKKKVLQAIWSAMSDEGIVFNSVFDAFSGSAVFSLFMKYMNKQVISNDFLTSSFLSSYAMVENPGFKLSYNEMMFVLDDSVEDKSKFVYDNYFNTRFTKAECDNLDIFRSKLSLLDNSYKSAIAFLLIRMIEAKLPFGGIDKASDLQKHRKKQMENYGKKSDKHDRRIGLYYDKDMNIDFPIWFTKYCKKFNELVFNKEYSFETHDKFLDRNIKQNMFHDLSFRTGNVNSLVNDFLNGKYYTNNNSLSKPCLSLNCDIIELLESTDFVTDVVYIDPPYGGNSTDYSYLYQFLEEYTYGKSISDIHEDRESLKRFSGKKGYEENFILMLDKMERFPVWVLSYNNKSWASPDYIKKILLRYKKTVNVYSVKDYIYNFRESRSTGTEYIYVAK